MEHGRRSSIWLVALQGSMQTGGLSSRDMPDLEGMPDLIWNEVDLPVLVLLKGEIGQAALLLT